MLELFVLVLGVAFLALLFKIGVVVLHLLLIPFQIVGGILLALLALPFALLALPVLLLGGVGAAVGIGLALPLLLVVGIAVVLACLAGLIGLVGLLM
ncbi:MAG: hypothetical protein ABIK65_12090 [Candidatus Eisenbacteria bacterium]